MHPCVTAAQMAPDSEEILKLEEQLQEALSHPTQEDNMEAESTGIHMSTKQFFLFFLVVYWFFFVVNTVVGDAREAKESEAATDKRTTTTKQDKEQADDDDDDDSELPDAHPH